MLLETSTGPFKKALATDSADASFAARIPKIAEPSGNGIIDLGSYLGGSGQNAIVAIPYATSGDDDTMSMRVWGWRKVGGEPGTAIWIPVLLFEIAVTMGATVGVVGTDIPATSRFADVITLTFGNSIEVNSPSNDLVGHVVAACKGFSKLDFEFDSTAVGTTGMNCLYAFI